MPRLSFVSLVAAVALVTIVPAARGELPHSIGRYLGVGWGDGYHSRAACPPKRHGVHHQAVPVATAAPATWWKIPADGTGHDAELLPHPAAQEPTTTGTFPPAGASLFRQPGEGSSVTVSSATGPAAGR